MAKEKPKLFNQEYQKEQSDKYKYKHIHTGEHCTFEAYVAEYLVLRRAERMNLEKPGYKFWTKGDPNHWIWMKQMNAARALAKRYSEEAVLAAIKSPDFNRYLVIGLQNGRGWKINPPIEPIIKKHHERLLREEKNRKEETLEVKDNPVRRKARPAGKGSILNKLRGKDGEKIISRKEEEV